MWGLDDNDGKDYDLIEPGVYVCKLTNSTLDTTTSGEEEDPHVLKVEYTVQSGKFERRKLWQNFRFNEKSLKWIRWQLGVMGVWEFLKGASDSKDAAMKAAENIFKLVEMDNVFFSIEVSHNEYNGKTYTNAKLEERISGPIPKSQALPQFDSSEEIPF
jgi:hypothetical protein